MIKIIVLLMVSSAPIIAQAQLHSTNRFADITGTVGSSQGTFAASYVYNWKIGKQQKIEIGLGARWTTYLGTKKDFLTAGPAEKTRTSTTPFLIFFAGQQEQNFDTLTVQRPLTNSLNLTINLGYNLSRKWYAGFNIDLIGFSFGRKGSGILTSNGTTTNEPNAKPSSFNVLLTGDHDKGTLNSEFFIKYQLDDRWALKAVYQFIFVEYETVNRKQTFSDGSSNDRFRNKANNFGLGIAYHFIK
ncbi:MAG: hypothetical protein H7122_11350 [Chitinophagaceae bacterium]|nr:hypothetical protein [Chitinophagaceae bacterium]